MKKVLAMLLVLIMAGALFSACGGEDGSSLAPPIPQEEDSQPVDSSSEEPPFATAKNINPFTGYEKAADYPNGKRAVAVMINNRKPALPHKGTSAADVLYEMVVEGGITRLMAVYSDYTKMPDVGMIRSARDQFVQLMFPYQAMYIHIGESALARDMMNRYEYEPQDLDGKVYSSLWWMGEQRDPTCYTCFTNGELISQTLAQYEKFDDNYEASPIFNFVPYNEAPRVPGDGAANSIHIQFSSDYYADFTYDADTRKYLKYDSMGRAQIDEDNNQQLAMDNVIVLFTDIHQRENSQLPYVDYATGGYGYYISQGHYEMVRWLKGEPHQPLRIVDVDGNEIDVQINCGKTYIAITDIATMFDRFDIDGYHPYYAETHPVAP